MLRITIHEEPKKVMLKLEGRIVGPWAAELNRIWHSLGPSLHGRKLSIDLCGISYIDRQGRGILADIYRQTHAQFEANTPLTEYFVEEARNSTSRTATEMGTETATERATKKEPQNERSLRF